MTQSENRVGAMPPPEMPAWDLNREAGVDPSEIVSTVAPGCAPGVTETGLNRADTPEGRPEIVNATGLANPFTVGVTVI